MNIATWSIEKKVITWVMTCLMVVVGIISFNSLSRLEDPEFTIKEALVLTPYPGASATEVEQDVTNVIEKACQELGQLDYVESRSSRGLSLVKAVIKRNYDKKSLPQVWDELRRKVNDAQGKLPPGAGPSLVKDDFGDVYGVYLAITGDGYSYKELYEYAKFLQRELLQVKDVQRIILYGNIPEAIYVEMRREKMAEFGISPNDIFKALASKNLPSPAGYMTIGKEYIAVNPTGEFTSEKQFGDLLIKGPEQGAKQLVYLRDVADIRRDYQDPPRHILRYDGKPAIGLAISTVFGGNVVTMGQALQKKLDELASQSPIGMELNVVALQSEAVTTAINGFLVNLAEAVAIVIVILLFFTGLRSGIIIGAILVVTITGTFIFMKMGNITLERISLGALVIALGMLVDNAIVVTDGMRIKMGQGVDALRAAREIVGQTAVPLLGATFIAIAAFAAIGTSPDSTGEYCRSLFYVILISLSLSWVTAVTSTPLLCAAFLKPGTSNQGGDPYQGRFYRLYKSFLGLCLKRPWVTVAIVVIVFVISGYGFGFVKKSFFPDSTRPQFYVDMWFPEGTHIKEVLREVKKAESLLLARKEFTHVTSHIGGGSPRFLLTYSPEYDYLSFARLVVDVSDYRIIAPNVDRLQTAFENKFPDALIKVNMFVNGPSTGGKIQLRISGPDPEVLRQLADKARAVMLRDPGARSVRNEWRNKVKVLRPVMAEAQAREAGINRPDIAKAMEMEVQGTPVGVYREQDELIPILARSPDYANLDLDNLQSLQIWSPAAGKMIPIGQVIKGFRIEFEDPYIWRRSRTRMIRIHADPRRELPAELFARIKPEVEKVLGVDVARVLKVRPDKAPPLKADTLKVREADVWPLKNRPGYYMAWGGEAEDSAKAGSGISASIPVFFGLMVLIVVWLFNSIKKTLIIWLTVPLAIVGVTIGLLIFKQPFGFMALLGLMSLAGMLIKNAIVLIDQIDLEKASGKPLHQAIVDSGVSRLIPVSMAALTTILGMLPLVQDAFFVSMAVTIMFGLGFATILTLIVVPVLYFLFYGWSFRKGNGTASGN